jgi:hypothetical protein
VSGPGNAAGYGDVTPTTTPEVLFTIVYVAINIVAWAYILGTITLLVTRQVGGLVPRRPAAHDQHPRLCLAC